MLADELEEDGLVPARLSLRSEQLIAFGQLGRGRLPCVLTRSWTRPLEQVGLPAPRARQGVADRLLHCPAPDRLVEVDTCQDAADLVA